MIAANPRPLRPLTLVAMAIAIATGASLPAIGRAQSSTLAAQVEAGAREKSPRDPGGGTAAASDTAMAARIKAAIGADAGMKDTDVRVSTTNGLVLLDGTVHSQDQVTIATTLAQRQEGVTRVESRIAVR